MSKKKRRRHSAKFKAKVALEAVKEIKTASEIGAEYEVHPAQISDWKRKLLGNLDSAFEKGSHPPVGCLPNNDAFLKVG